MDYPKMNELKTEFENYTKRVEQELCAASEEELNYKASKEHWSALECVEHLIHYNKYYNKEIAKAIDSLSSTEAAEEAKLSWFGKISIKMVDPQNTKKAKAIKRMMPSGESRLAKSLLDSFLVYLKDLMVLAEKAQGLNYNKKKVRVEFIKLIRLNVYESLVFMLKHQERHLNQAIRAIKALKKED
jgi:hypothetical protein